MKSTVAYNQFHDPDDQDITFLPGEQALFARYEEIAWAEELQWSTRYKKQRLLGAGGQGAVYLADRLGADGFVRPVALKVFSPETYRNRAAYLKDQGNRTTMESAMAKLYASETAVKAADDCVQIHGGYGFVKDYPAEKFFRDVKLTTIGEGTSEIQRLVIARQLFAR